MKPILNGLASAASAAAGQPIGKVSSMAVAASVLRAVLFWMCLPPVRGSLLLLIAGVMLGRLCAISTYVLYPNFLPVSVRGVRRVEHRATAVDPRDACAQPCVLLL